MNQKQKQIERVKPILSKGKMINDIIFVSKKISEFDIAFMLLIMRPTKEESKTKLINIKFGKNTYGWNAKDIYNMAENPVLTGGGDGLEQLVFGCAAALDVYTEDEILTVLDAIKEFHK